MTNFKKIYILLTTQLILINICDPTPFVIPLPPALLTTPPPLASPSNTHIQHKLSGRSRLNFCHVAPLGGRH